MSRVSYYKAPFVVSPNEDLECLKVPDTKLWFLAQETATKDEFIH